jgi:hypothetical protein
MVKSSNIEVGLCYIHKHAKHEASWMMTTYDMSNHLRVDCDTIVAIGLMIYIVESKVLNIINMTLAN